MRASGSGTVGTTHESSRFMLRTPKAFPNLDWFATISTPKEKEEGKKAVDLGRSASNLSKPICLPISYLMARSGSQLEQPPSLFVIASQYICDTSLPPELRDLESNIRHVLSLNPSCAASEQAANGEQQYSIQYVQRIRKRMTIALPHGREERNAPVPPCEVLYDIFPLLLFQ